MYPLCHYGLSSTYIGRIILEAFAVAGRIMRHSGCLHSGCLHRGSV